MESKVNYLLVGLFVLILATALVAGVLWFSVGGFYHVYDRYLVFTSESVSGLNVDAQVTFKGVPVGRVAGIAISPSDPERVRILIEVAEDTPVRTDTRAILRMQGLTGLLTVDLIGTSEEAPPLELVGAEPYPVIESVPSLMTNLEENVSELLYDLKGTVRRVNRLLAERNLQNVAAILANLEVLTSRVASRSDEVAQALGDFSAVMANARDASEALPRLIEQFNEAAEALEVMAASLADTGQLLNEQIDASAGDIRRFTRDSLPEAAALIDELYQAARSFRQLSERLERNPSALIYGLPAPRPGPGE